MTELNYTETLTVVRCTCGIAYAIPAALDQQLLDHPRVKSAYCPLGHKWYYTGKTEAEKLAEKLAAEQRRLAATRDLLVQEERSHAATRGHLTRQRRRAAAGVCPCCQRTFQNVAAHVQSKHPDFNPGGAADANADH